MNGFVQRYNFFREIDAEAETKGGILVAAIRISVKVRAPDFLRLLRVVKGIFKAVSSIVAYPINALFPRSRSDNPAPLHHSIHIELYHIDSL